MGDEKTSFSNIDIIKLFLGYEVEDLKGRISELLRTINDTPITDDRTTLYLEKIHFIKESIERIQRKHEVIKEAYVEKLLTGETL